MLFMMWSAHRRLNLTFAIFPINLLFVFFSFSFFIFSFLKYEFLFLTLKRLSACLVFVRAFLFLNLSEIKT